jgi:Rhs element Vgr protein
MTTRLLPIARSTGLATFTIEVDGEPLPQRLPVYSIEVLHEANRVPSARILIADGDAATGEWPVSSGEHFVPGNEIRILAGYQSEEEPVFAGIVVGQALRVRHGRLELQVSCRHAVVALTTAKKSRHFADADDRAAVLEILDAYGIAGEIAPTPAAHVDLVQYDATDWDFVVMRMEANGLVCIAEDDGLHAVAPAADAEPVATIQFGANVIEFDADLDARRQLGTVTAETWDPGAQDAVVASAADPGWTTPGNLTPAELAGAAGGETHVLRHGGALPPDELQSWSDAVLLRSRMAMLRGRARVQGLAAVRPNRVVELAGFGARCNGPAWVGAVRHEIGLGNWLTDLELGLPEQRHAERHAVSAPPASGLLPAVSGLRVGVVTTLESDPAGEGRIRVRIPSVDLEGEGVWARVATLDAGASRGTLFLPELGDEVVVGFLHDDPRYPVVLGMLHSSANARPEEPSDDNHIRGIYSRSGMRLVFDDESSVLTLDTPAGHTLVLDDDAGELRCTDGNGNRIVLSSSGIRIESAGELLLKAAGDVKVEAQQSLEMKASMQWKAEGSAGTELTSSAVTVVKGSLVQIN